MTRQQKWSLGGLTSTDFPVVDTVKTIEIVSSFNKVSGISYDGILIQFMHTIMVPVQVKTMKIQAGVQVLRQGENSRRHLPALEGDFRDDFILPCPPIPVPC
ncbi:hypothetical protein Tco_0549198 [Tanacetum coccineum]